MKPHFTAAKIQEKTNSVKLKKELRSTSKHEIKIMIDPVGITRFLTASIILLLFASVCANYLTGIDLVRRYGRLLNVDEEKNIPTAFSVLLLQFAATLLSLIAILKWKKSRWKAFNWIFLSAGFFFMAADEGWGIHEWFGNKAVSYHGFLLFSWVLVFTPLVLFLFIFFLKFLLDLPRRTRLLFIGSGILYLGGAIFLESLSTWSCENKGIHSFSYISLTTLEEALEMFGVVLFIYSLLDYLNYQYQQFRLTFKKSGITLQKFVSKNEN